MKKLVFATLLLGGLSQATGCIITSDDTVDTGSFFVSWTLESGLASPAGAITCAEAGVTTIRTVSEPTGGAQIIDLFDCVNGQQETAPLPIADYLVWTEALDSSDALVAQSFASEESIFDTNPVGVDFRYPVDIGWFGFTWTLTNATVTPEQPLTCAEFGGDGVMISAIPVNGTGTGPEIPPEIFNCTDGVATTTVTMPLQEYDIVVSLIDATNRELGRSDVRREVLTFGNQLVDLGNFDFADDGTR